LISPNSSKKTPLTAMQFSRYTRAPARNARVPVRPTASEGGAAGDPRRNAPGPGLSKLNSRRLLELHTPRECGEKTVQTRCQRYFQASPTDTTFKLEGENGAGR
jgi:hypothetical protein